MVNITDSVKIEGDFGTEALHVLRQIPGFEVRAHRSTDKAGDEASIRFAGARRSIAVRFKQRVNAANAWQFVHQTATHSDAPLLVVAGETTAESRAILTRNGIAVADGSGNVHIELPGLLIHLEGTSGDQSSQKSRPSRLIGKSGVIAQALMLQPDRSWQISELAAEANVSASLVHRVLNRLEDEKVVATEGSGPATIRRVVDPSALLDLWAEEENDQPLRTQGYLLAQSPGRLVENVSLGLSRAEIDYAFTGAVAANILAPLVTALPLVTLWIPIRTTPNDVLSSVGGESVSDGANLIILQQKDDTPLAFREQKNGLWLSNRFRLYVDLLRDPRRGREQADHIRKEVIGF